MAEYPVKEYAIDEPVYVALEHSPWIAGHFAGYVMDAPTIWSDGRTSHTTTLRSSWQKIKKNEPKTTESN